MTGNRASTVLVSAALTFMTFAAASQQSEPQQQLSVDAERFQAVVCLMPGRVRRLGNMVYTERRKVVETTANECRRSGGEYTVYDRANDDTAMEFWKRELSLAQSDEERAKAETYVGELYEKRLGAPNYAEAARWYQMAVDHGSSRAKLHLAHLYESGLGVERDLPQALTLWRDGMGIAEGLVVESELAAVRTEAQLRINDLTAALDRQNQTTQRLQQTVTESSATITRQRADLAAAQGELDALARQIEQERATPRGNPAQLAELQRQVDARTIKISDQQAEIAKLELLVNGQRTQLDTSAQMAAINESQLQQALDTIATQRAENTDLSAELKRQDALIAKLERDVSAATSDLEQRRASQADLERQVAALTAAAAGDTTNAGARTALLQEQLTETQREVAARRADLSRLQGILESQRAAFAQTMQAANVDRDSLAGEVARLKGQRQVLEGQLAQRSSDAAALRASLTNGSATLASSAQEIEELTARIAALQLAAANDTEVADLQRQLAAQSRAVEQQQAEIEAARAEWQTAVADAASLRQQLDARAASDTDAQVRMKAQVALLEQQKLDLANDRDRLEQVIAANQVEKNALIRNVETLRQELRSAQEGTVRRDDAQRARVLDLNEQLAQKEKQLVAQSAAIRSLQGELDKVTLDYQQLLTQRNLYAGVQAGPTPPAAGVTAGLTRGNALPVRLPADVDLSKYRFRAVIIGNWDYTFMGDLDTVKQDVTDVAQLLRGTYGFDQVDVRMNLTLDEMYEELGKLPTYAENEFVLIYYAGHGTVDELGNGYWQPIDYLEGKSLATSAVSVAQITQHINMMQAKHVMVVADSCYAGALLRDNTIEVQNVDQRLKHWINNGSRTVLTSGGVGPVLDSGSGTHSVFAEAFIDVLADNAQAAGILSGATLHARIRNTIRNESRQLKLEQTPLFAGLAEAGHGGGQFVFVPRRDSQARLN